MKKEYCLVRLTEMVEEMTDTEKVMKNFYDTLLELRYPEITKAEPSSIEITILSGENRISLLSWLLAEKSIPIATAIAKLKGDALEDELLKYYSEIGIFTTKDLLLGKCPMKTQLPNLKLLLNFIKCVHIEPFNNMLHIDESIDDMVKMYINENSKISSELCNIQPKVTLAEAEEYFKQVKMEVENHCEKSIDFAFDELKDLHISPEQSNNTECDEPLSPIEEKFLEAFQTIGSWQIPNKDCIKNTSYSMDMDIKNISSGFSHLNQVLQAVGEITKINLRTEFKKADSDLSPVIEEAVLSMEKCLDVNTQNYPYL